MERARKDGVDTYALFPQTSGQPIFAPGEIEPSEVSAGDSRLVCDLYDRHPKGSRRPDQLGNSRQQLDLIRIAEIDRFLDDYAVAVEKQGWQRVVRSWEAQVAP